MCGEQEGGLLGRSKAGMTGDESVRNGFADKTIDTTRTLPYHTIREALNEKRAGVPRVSANVVPSAQLLNPPPLS